jgi:hypothetical protein
MEDTQTRARLTIICGARELAGMHRAPIRFRTVSFARLLPIEAHITLKSVLYCTHFINELMRKSQLPDYAVG